MLIKLVPRYWIPLLDLSELCEDRVNITKGGVCLFSHLERVLLGYTTKSGQTNAWETAANL